MKRIVNMIFGVFLGIVCVFILAACGKNSSSSSSESSSHIEYINVVPTFESKEFVYDGNVKSLVVKDIPEDVEVTYYNNDKIEAGTYEVTAVLSSSNNAYIFPNNIKASLTISKRNDVKYTINYYYENIDNEDFTLLKSEEKDGDSYSEVECNCPEVEHFVLDEEKSTTKGNIGEDDYDLELNLYYKREVYSVSINMQYRIAIDFQIEGETIIPINIGDHKEIYGN